MNTRAKELQERFDAIETALAEVAGKDMAWAAASGAWLQVIQHAMKVQLEILTEHPAHAMARLPEFLEENQQILQGFHQQLCKHASIDPKDALRMVNNFKEVMRDIVK